MLCGCSFFTHDEERDLRQVVATVDSYEITNSVKQEAKDSDGNVKKDEAGETVYETVSKKFVTESKTIYKRDLVEYVNSNYNNLAQSATSTEQVYRKGIELLLNIEIIINEVDALIDAGSIEWGLTETNAVKKQMYDIIDSTLISTQNEILAARDEGQIVNTGDGELNTSTTYPVRSDEKAEDVKDTEVWEPEITRYPGLYGDADKRSLEREALRRFIAMIEERVEDDFRVTAEDRAKFDEDIKKINEITDRDGLSYVYPILGDTHILYYITGESIEQSQKLQLLQNYLTDSVDVDDERVLESYRNLLNTQRSAYDDPATGSAAYDKAMSAGDTVLYHPNNNHFYVKHILLPFSDAQTASLNAYKSGTNVTKEEVNRFRDRLVENIVCYPHVMGEDDKSKPMTVDQVLAEIKAVMLPLEGSPRQADAAFTDLVYKYNTDPGAFDNNKGYVLKYKLGAEDTDQWVEEFASAARALRKNQAVGEVYKDEDGNYAKIVTDYGVHIMYFASVVEQGVAELYGYTAPNETETYFDVLKAPIVSTLEGVVYQNWENRILSYNYNKYSKIYDGRMTNLWE